MIRKTIGYRKTYKLRVLVPGRRYISVGLPYEVVEREAANRGITVDEFLKRFVAVSEYDNFDGVHYTFREIKSTSPGLGGGNKK